MAAKTALCSPEGTVRGDTKQLCRTTNGWKKSLKTVRPGVPPGTAVRPRAQQAEEGSESRDANATEAPDDDVEARLANLSRRGLRNRARRDSQDVRVLLLFSIARLV